jgi:hypothetical protein
VRTALHQPYKLADGDDAVHVVIYPTPHTLQLTLVHVRRLDAQHVAHHSGKLRAEGGEGRAHTQSPNEHATSAHTASAARTGIHMPAHVTGGGGDGVWEHDGWGGPRAAALTS